LKKNNKISYRPVIRQTKYNKSVVKPVKSNKRCEDFHMAFERFLAEYRMDRIADVHDFLNNNLEYKKYLKNKTQSEYALKMSIKNDDTLGIFLDYVTSVDLLVDEVQAIFYEHGFQDCVTISKAIHNDLDSGLLRTLIELDRK
jgi:hypothetical protein